MRIGLDLVDEAEIAEAIAQFGVRYLDRIYTPAERARTRDAPVRLAACFAAKEAAMKILRAGDEVLPWQSIALCVPERRWELSLDATATALMHARGFTRLSVDVAPARTGACAIVLGITERTHSPR